MRLAEFLRPFYPDENETIFFRAFRPKGAPDDAGNRPAMLSTTRRQLAQTNGEIELRKLNHLCGIYYAPNAGGHTDHEITRFNAVFVENDSLTIEEQHAALDKSSIQTSIRVETKRSVHGYWLLKGNCTLEEWREMQKRLIQHFDGDKAIKNPSRVMRVPFFMHLTYNEQSAGKHDYRMVQVVQFEPAQRYTIDALRTAFPELYQANGSARFGIPDTINNGNRNNELFSLAGSLRRTGLAETEILATLKEVNRTRTNPPLPMRRFTQSCITLCAMSPVMLLTREPLIFRMTGRT